ncbi:MAG: hypothetical protein A3J38_05165 [Gammaproteobacteria bacterium RIFCSPHIGHO2_12_FULL_45_9]|nr:MAG: hypothetical protein A3J38_05165 [Gammaproteobacteria bacterium RIFCSPHIGHO2_12_FULL_45_9]
MTFHIIVLLLFAIILYCLGSGAYHLIVHKKGHSEKLAKALTWRISLSIALFLLIILSYFLGWAHPHGVTAMSLVPST